MTLIPVILGCCADLAICCHQRTRDWPRAADLRDFCLVVSGGSAVVDGAFAGRVGRGSAVCADGLAGLPGQLLLRVLFTRVLMSGAVGIAWGFYSATWPFLMYFNQVSGALLKTLLSFRLNKQGCSGQRVG